MIQAYQEAIRKLRKLDKENDKLIFKFSGEAKYVAIATKLIIESNILMFESLEEQLI